MNAVRNSTFVCCTLIAVCFEVSVTAAQEAAPRVGTTPDAASSSWWSRLPKPQLTMPQVTMPKVTMPTFSAPSAGNLFAPVKASAGKVTAGAKQAWAGTKELFSFARGSSDEEQVRLASRQEPSMLQKMFGGGPPEDTGPQTIGEFMQGTRPK